MSLQNIEKIHLGASWLGKDNRLFLTTKTLSFSNIIGVRSLILMFLRFDYFDKSNKAIWKHKIATSLCSSQWHRCSRSGVKSLILMFLRFHNLGNAFSLSYILHRVLWAGNRFDGFKIKSFFLITKGWSQDFLNIGWVTEGRTEDVAVFELE